MRACCAVGRRWREVAHLAAIIALGLTVSCSGDAKSDACDVAGRQRSCTCDGVGIQTCQLDGRWDACQCFIPIGGAKAAGGGTSGGSGGVGTGAGGARAGAGGVGGAPGLPTGLQAGRGWGGPGFFGVGTAGRRP